MKETFVNVKTYGAVVSNPVVQTKYVICRLGPRLVHRPLQSFVGRTFVGRCVDAAVLRRLPCLRIIISTSLYLPVQ